VPRHIQLAVRNDEELSRLLGHAGDDRKRRRAAEYSDCSSAEGNWRKAG